MSSGSFDSSSVGTPAVYGINYANGYAFSASTGGVAVYASGGTKGVLGIAPLGLYGIGNGTGSVGCTGTSDGTSATGGDFECTGSGSCGVYAKGVSYAVYAVGPGYFSGYLSKGGGGFQIDHPLDPENKYLYHGFVEAPEMSNLYKGIITLDASGNGSASLPAYFDSINTDCVPQLTAIGASMPNLFAEEIVSGQFNVRGGVAGKKVAWMVMGTRNDAWCKANKPGVEVEKATEHKGKFLHPELFGKDPSMHAHFIPGNK